MDGDRLRSIWLQEQPVSHSQGSSSGSEAGPGSFSQKKLPIALVAEIQPIPATRLEPGKQIGRAIGPAESPVTKRTGWGPRTMEQPYNAIFSESKIREHGWPPCESQPPPCGEDERNESHQAASGPRPLDDDDDDHDDDDDVNIPALSLSPYRQF